ncbi:hypothetical protein FA95DRAFT_1559499 [Auriscalpium vulgare]|uniref:Uncharacterized protein n=1 Tax=Auriscalpium vulgare TaxID=40419 RepID=A0ACB8RU59_9AGAM|nr:hypothetical protein FA95DRAFT_1559499 [Auriscalpium vulgare]
MKRARVAKPSTSRPSPSPEPLNPHLCLPTELLYDVIATALGDYLSDLILEGTEAARPRSRDWDAIFVFLHVSRSFRACTIKLMYHLWGDTFIHERTRAICNYKPTLSIFTRLAKIANDTPGRFHQERKPKLLSERIIRHPLSPLARLWSCFIRNTANANACVAEDLEDDDLPGVFPGSDYRLMKESYNEIPAGVRDLLLGRVMRHIVLRSALWFKLNAMSLSINNIFRMVFMMAFSDLASDDFAPDAHDPIRTDADISTLSRRMHERIGTLFDLTPDEIPEISFRELEAVGFGEAIVMLSMLENESATDTRGRFCRFLRLNLATHLTDWERRRFMAPWAAGGQLSFFALPREEGEGTAAAAADVEGHDHEDDVD